ncbi:protein-cysteine N-palmitoyltransferase HHAT-like protein, partial [Dinothrombium tinctorium]
ISSTLYITLLQLRIYFLITFGSSMIQSILSTKALVFVWSNILIAILIHLTSIRSLCYIFFLSIIAVLHREPFAIIKNYLLLDEDQSFLFEVSVAWLNARCLSFSIDRIHKTSLTFHDFLLITSYCLYLPSFFTGPINDYLSFVSNITNESTHQSSHTMRRSLLNIARYLFWALILDMLLHFVYSSSVYYNFHILSSFNAWELSGFGYALPCLFYLKYLVIYGFVGAIAAADGISMPSPPKCITRIHLCSYLWRHFDRGLHLWLLKYFYKPVINGQWTFLRRVFGTAVCFACVGLWHGIDTAIIVWCLLSFMGVIIENFGSILEDLNIVKQAKVSENFAKQVNCRNYIHYSLVLNEHFKSSLIY